jgi:hypothetical protein
LGALSCLILPLFDLYTRAAYYFVSGLSLPWSNYLSPLEVAVKFILPSQRSFDLYRYYLSGFLDIPYLIVYALVAIAIVAGRKKFGREVYFFLLVLLTSAICGEVYGLWSQSRTYLRIGTTILPWLLLIFSSFSLIWIYPRLKQLLSMFSLRVRSNKLRISPRSLLIVGFCFLIATVTTFNYVLAPMTNTYNASVDQVNAVKYIVAQNPARDALIFSDGYTLKLLSVYSNASWYGFPYGERLWLDALTLTTPMYYEVLDDPYNLDVAVHKGISSMTDALSQVNVEYNASIYYFVYAANLASYDEHYISPNLTEKLSSILGLPVVFGNVYVYSGNLNFV